MASHLTSTTVARFNAVVNRRVHAWSRVGRWRPLTVAAAAVLSLRAATLAAPKHGESADFAIVAICSDDTPEAAAAFLRATRHVFLESRVGLRIQCGGVFPTSECPITARFIADEDGIALQLVSPAEEQSTRRIPWLEDVHRPLRKTLALGKGTALALLLESLTADLQTVRFRPLPMPPSFGRSVTAEPRFPVVETRAGPRETARNSAAEPPRVSIGESYAWATRDDRRLARRIPAVCAARAACVGRRPGRRPGHHRVRDRAQG